jgi:alpha-D-ribose 1-methylphosphonate 5-triphosphate synthase subunit PhnH
MNQSYQASEELLLTQQAFRTVMDATAMPGTVAQLPAMSQATLANAYLETLVCMLIDNTTGFYAMFSDEGLSTNKIAARSYARQVAAGFAQFAIFAADADETAASEQFMLLFSGSDMSPESSATAIIECESVSPSAEPYHFFVTGPGVESYRLFTASSDWWRIARELRRDEYPLGLDLLLVDRRGRLVALPRTSKIAISLNAIAGAV